MPLVRKPTGPSPTSNLEGASVATALASANPEERWAAARATVDLTDAPAAVAAALRKETDSRVREALFTSLARIGTADSVREALSLLRSDDANLRTGALDALRVMAGPVRQLLPGMLNDRDVDVRILSCELVRSLPSEEASQLLCDLLAAEREVNVCAAAIEVLSEVGSPAAIATLVECGRRFPDAPFIGFSIKIATERINAQIAPSRG